MNFYFACEKICFILISIYSIYNNLKENTILVTEINNIIYTLFSLVIYFICLEENMLVALLISFIYLSCILIGMSSLVSIHFSFINCLNLLSFSS